MLKSSKRLTLYERLEVSPQASINEIRRAYHKLVKKYHKKTDNVNTKEFNDQLMQINIAYNVLKDPVKRKQYDQLLAEEAAQQRQKTPTPPSIRIDLFKEAKEAIAESNFVTALKHIRLALEKKNSDPELLSLLCFVLTNLDRDLGEAKHAIRKAIRLDPEEPMHYYHLGFLYEKANQKDKASEQYQMALKKDAGFQKARKALERINMKGSFLDSLKGMFKK